MDTAAPDPVLSGQGVTSPRGNSADGDTPPPGARVMARLVRTSTPPLWLGLVVATSFVVLETLAVYPLQRFATVGTLSLYLVGVVVVAIVWGFRLAAITAVVSALAYDYFLTPPLHEISIFTHPQADDGVALSAFLVFALLTSTLTDLARSRAAEANRCRREAEASRDRLNALATHQAALRRVATLVAREVPPSEVFNAVAEEMARCLDADNATVVRYEGDAIVIEAVGRPELETPNKPVVGERFALDGDHVAAIIQRTGRPARMDSPEHVAGAVAARLREIGVQSMVGVPIVVGAHLWGVAGVASSRTGPLPADTESRIVDFADLVATAIANAATSAELQAGRDSLRELADSLSVLARQQAALRRVATLVARGVSPSEVFSAVAEEMAGCLNVGNAEVLRYEDDGAAIVVVASYAAPGVPHPLLGERISTEGDNVASMVLRTRQSARMDSWEGAAGPIAERVRELGVRSRVGAPIVVDERLWGIAVVATTERDPLPPDTEGRIVEFAELVATAIAAATTRAELIASRARIVAAADHARRCLERDLHDGAQQRLIALGLKLRAAEAAVAPDQIELKTELSEAISDLLEVSNELQEISRGIHPAILSQGGLASALDTLAIRSPVPVDLDLAINLPLSDPVEVAAYYVVAEALTNAAKHAHASQVIVSAKTHDDTLSLSIDDDGIGGADSGKQGSGLIGLKDRVEVLGGRMHISSPPGSGTSLNVTIPLDSEETLDSAAPESSSSGDDVRGAGIRG
jgi:signal transduction histidine kinase